jgi:hypothetical protein
MSVKRFFLSGLVGTLLGLGAAQGQDLGGPYTGMGAGPPPPPAPGSQMTAPPAPPRAELSDWIVYPRAPGCCGPIGRNGPIYGEVYLRNGASFPLANGVFGHALATGWDVQGGVRALLFNPAREAAWTIDLSINNIHNTSHHQDVPIQLLNVEETVVILGNRQTITLPEANVTIKGLNRTFVNLAGGREWYLMGTGDPCMDGWNWRAGFDVGGRYGTARLDFNEIQHKTGALSGLFLAIHSDVEFPCKCCIFNAGLRLEWDYNWTTLLQKQNYSDFQELNLLLTTGIRY